MSGSHHPPCVWGGKVEKGTGGLAWKAEDGVGVGLPVASPRCDSSPMVIGIGMLLAAGGALVVGELVAGAFVAAALLAGGAVWLGFFPFLPRDLGGAPDLDSVARRVRVPLPDQGDALDGWLLPARERAVVLVLHGYGRDHSRAWRYGAFLHAAGYGVFAVDFRSSRGSRRLPTTLGHHEVVDAQAALDWLRAERSLAGCTVGLLGESLGGSVALLVAAENPAVDAVVVDGAFAHATLALEDSSQRWARLPRRSAGLARLVGRVVTGRDLGGVDVETAAASLAGRPVFIIHALGDDRLSSANADRLWRAAGAKDPLWIIPDAGHNEGWRRHPVEYECPGIL
jgi:alpha-beta hydrolase superfamily lysophospholipase